MMILMNGVEAEAIDSEIENVDGIFTCHQRIRVLQIQFHCIHNIFFYWMIFEYFLLHTSIPLVHYAFPFYFALTLNFLLALLCEIEKCFEKAKICKILEIHKCVARNAISFERAHTVVCM
ncbi:unnamed protein product [Ceratitis capitata]|uniref:(Mediterranean fruit fly) hypothetical protein n=1 Tax=Ceratitis capitata TaxID=7213 RepID=A0A811V643_CERCA|nr:unnamed protein product [Ceratitis capitata]